jgi:MtaA/CmuA family methyltransferase
LKLKTENFPMTSRQLVQAALAGDETPRFPAGPLAVHNTAALAGVSIEDYTLDPAVMVDCVCRYYERFRPDAVWLSADTWITAEAVGAAVAFPGAGQPMGGTDETLVRSAVDIDRLPASDPESLGRMPKMLEALRLLRARLGDEVFIVGCFDQSPFSLACALADINEVMMLLVTDPPFVEALLEKCIEHAAAYAVALGRAGADMLSTGDSPAGMIGPDFYEELALPAERRVFEAIRAGCGVPSSLHICGDSTHILSAMATSGAEVLEIDHQVSLDDACRMVPDTVALWGNVDPVEVMNNGTPEAVRRACAEAVETVRRHGRRRFVLSSGCTLAPGTPPENIAAMIESVRAEGEPDTSDTSDRHG